MVLSRVLRNSYVEYRCISMYCMSSTCNNKIYNRAIYRSLASYMSRKALLNTPDKSKLSNKARVMNCTHYLDVSL